jgi:hypothetical protein
MGIEFAAPPPKLVAALSSDLKKNATRGEWTISTLSGMTGSKLSIGSGHRVYTMGLDQIAAGYKASQLEPQAWRFLVTAGKETVAAVESDNAPSTKAGTGKLASVNAGRFVESTASALAALAGEKSVASEGKSEPRLLRIPALYVMALWLHDEKTGKDSVQVLAPAPDFLTVDKVYGMDEFLAALKAPAEQRLAFDDAPH